ncbi:MAG: toll/interleukin-1 receptor domain-containing protein [Nitrospira sp.]|nr:toll/interleukin-1 receptor domain-containing protein [Nitrospira sp.]
MYACFISYCHGQHDLTKAFISQLKQALKSYLEPYMDEEVYIDEDRLKPGYQYNEELASVICKSVCMIVVYSPRYERHSYCVREFEGMRLVEQERRAKLGSAWSPAHGMIIPIIFRGDPAKLPDEIKAHRHYCDFTRFTTADTDISKNPQYITEIEKIAKAIYEHVSSFEASGIELCSDCINFRLPSENEIPTWRSPAQRPRAVFPGREPQS